VITFGQAKYAVAAVLALVATACGGNGGNGGSSNALSRGAIQRFGSVVVNGVTWSTSGATLKLDDSTVTLGSEAEIQSHLSRGMEIEVRGSLDDNGTTGKATEIRFGEDFQGAVSGPSTASGFTVLGINVVVDASTVIVNSAGSPQPLSAIGDGTWVEVSGRPDVNNSFRATFVKIEDAPGALDEVKGFVVNPTGSSFGLAMTPGGAAFMNVTAASIPAAGTYVEVKGTFDVGASTMAASSIEIEDLPGDNGLRAEVEGIVLSGTLAEFTIGRMTVRTSASTVYRGVPAGSSAAAEFALGIKLEAEGSISNGVLNASKVKFKDASRLGGVPTGVTVSGFTMLGIPVAIDGATRIDGSIGGAAFVEVRGYRRVDGSVYAQDVRVRNSGDRPFLQGLVEAEGASSVTIAGIEADIGAGTEFQNEDEQVISASQFFDLVDVGQTIVKVRWESETSAITDPVKEAEIEIEDD
jgi:hypothetical protein